MGKALNPEVTASFLAWHSKRRERQTGHPLTEATASSMASRLRSAYKVSGATSPEQFAEALADGCTTGKMLDELGERNSTGSLRLVYEACQAYHAYGTVQGWVAEPFAMERPAKSPAKPVKVYSADEVERLIGAALGVSLHWHAFVATFAHTGRRLNELLSLRWEWLNLDAEVPHFDLPTTKNKRQAYVPLDSFLIERIFTPENMAAMQAVTKFRKRDAGTFVFPWAQEKTVRLMLERHCERVGVPYAGFHRFRHTRATELLARGVPINAVSKLLGHANVTTTAKVYDHTTALTFAHYLEPDENAPSKAPAPLTAERREDGRPALRVVS